MRLLRALLVASSVLALSATALSAQGGKVTCKDGSKSDGGRGACSGQGGVMTAAMKSAAKAQAKADAKAVAKAARTEKTTTKSAGKVERTDSKAATKVEKTTSKAATKIAKAEKKAEARAEKTAAAARAKDDDHDARGATAECKDHTYSHAKSHQGACSRHGGVAKFLSGNE